MFRIGKVAFGMLVLVFRFGSFALDCSFQKRDLHVPGYDSQSTVKVNCTWNNHSVNGSQGWIFGALIFNANRTCKIQSERILTIIVTSSTMEYYCPSLYPNFKNWCKTYLTNASVGAIDADSKVITSVEFPVQSLFKNNISYNGTANGPILLYWLPHFTGQHDKTADECIINVTFGGNSTNVTSPPADTPKPTTGGNSPPTTTPLPFTTQLKPGGNSTNVTSPPAYPPKSTTGKSLTSGEIAAIVFGIVVVLVAIALLWRYRARAGCFKSCDRRQMSMAALPLDPNNTPAPAIQV